MQIISLFFKSLVIRTKARSCYKLLALVLGTGARLSRRAWVLDSKIPNAGSTLTNGGNLSKLHELPVPRFPLNLPNEDNHDSYPLRVMCEDSVTYCK